MKASFLAATAGAVVLAAGIGSGHAEQSGSGGGMQQGQHVQMMQEGQQGEPGRGMQQRMRGMMEPGMMGPGMMRHHMGGHGKHHGEGHGKGHMMRIMFAVMDANGDGALSLEEVQEISARIFAHVDANDDGKVTRDEIRGFYHGGSPDTAK